MPPMGERGWLPIVGWLRRYRRQDVRFDVIAGITVSALVVPKALGYAEIAQLPVECGLYAAAAGALLYALFGTSRQISTGPSSALAAVAASAVVLTGVAAGDQTVELVAAITLATGLLFVVAAVLRMGWLSRFLSRAVITGFLFGAAIDVIIGELPKLTGTDADGTNSWRELADWFAASATSTGPRCSSASSPSPSSWCCTCRAAGARSAGARRRRARRLAGRSTSPTTAWPPSGRCPAACRRRSCRPSIWSATTPRRS